MADDLGTFFQFVLRQRRSVNVEPALQPCAVDADRARFQRIHFGGTGLAQRARITRHHVVAVRDHSLQRVYIALRLGGDQFDLGRDFFDRSEPDRFEDADIHPADVKFVPTVRQLGRCGIRMVVVVQLFAADQDAPRHDVGARVFRLKIAVAPPVADAVDHAGGQERNPHHLHCPHGNADGAKQDKVHHQHGADADAVMRAVDVFFQPVVGRAVAVVFQRIGFCAFVTIQFRALDQHLGDTENLRAVRIVNSFAFRMVLAVYGRPGLGGHTRRAPQPEAEKMTDDRMQIQRAMRGMAMQINRHRSDGNVCQAQRGQYVTPPRQVQQSSVHNSPRLQLVITLAVYRSLPVAERAFWSQACVADVEN